MSYLVLARKWRPRRFDEMVGQEHVLRAVAVDPRLRDSLLELNPFVPRAFALSAAAVPGRNFTSTSFGTNCGPLLARARSDSASCANAGAAATATAAVKTATNGLFKLMDSPCAGPVGSPGYCAGL